MNTRQLFMTAAFVLALSAPAFAQDNNAATPAMPAIPASPSADGGAATPATPAVPATPGARLNPGEETQRDVNQQNRVGQGLQSGQLSTGEAAGIEKGEARIDKTEAKDMKDGSMSPAEKARLQQMQNRESQRIYNDRHNDKTGNPDSASSQRMQGDVQRDANQQQRIHNGVKNGTLTNRETGRMERGQMRNDRAQWRGGRDGRMGRGEQRRMQNHENRASRGIHQGRHNGQGRHGRGRG